MKNPTAISKIRTEPTLYSFCLGKTQKYSLTNLQTIVICDSNFQYKVAKSCNVKAQNYVQFIIVLTSEKPSIAVV